MHSLPAPFLRRGTIGVALAGLLATSAFVGGPIAAADSITPVPARPSDSLVDSYGVIAHLAYTGTPYADLPAIQERLRTLGVRHLRTRLYGNRPDEYAAMKAVAALGIRFDVVMGTPTSPETPAELVETIAEQMPSGVVESLEGANEWDLSERAGWADEVRAHQRDLWAAAKAEPATSTLPVLAPALGGTTGFAELGDLSTYADYGNLHIYPGGQPPSVKIDYRVAQARTVTGDKPVIVTESGYHNALNTTQTHFPSTESAAGLYAPRLLLEHYLRGTARVYTYELVDQRPDGALVDREANFGLLHNDLSPKPAYTSMVNLIGLTADPGTAFSAGSLAYRVDGGSSDLRQILLQKRDGTFVILLWRDVAVYDARSETDLPVTPTAVTVQLQNIADVTEYRPSSSAGAVGGTVGTSIPVALSGDVVALTVRTLSAPQAPTAVSASRGNGSATVTWSPPASTGGSPVSSYTVLASPGGAGVTAGPDARTARVDGLTNGVAYTFTVTAANIVGSSPASAASTAVVPATFPAKPKTVAATAGNKKATVTWTAPVRDGGSRITAYRIVPSPNGTPVTVAATARSVVISGLKNNVKYTFTVHARNAVGAGAGAVTAAVRPHRPR